MGHIWRHVKSLWSLAGNRSSDPGSGVGTAGPSTQRPPRHPHHRPLHHYYAIDIGTAVRVGRGPGCCCVARGDDLSMSVVRPRSPQADSAAVLRPLRTDHRPTSRLQPCNHQQPGRRRVARTLRRPLLATATSTASPTPATRSSSKAPAAVSASHRIELCPAGKR